MSEIDELAAMAVKLAEVAAGRVEAERGQRIAQRLAAGRFLVSVVGEFKRGKSTLINALVGEEVVPTGVLPVTAVATELRHGDPGAVAEFLDGHREPTDRVRVADLVTEAGNPGNQRRVARVEVRGCWPLLEPGVVLVDTPGIGSVHVHNTEAARAALLDADGALVVLSADAPMSEQDRDLVRLLAQRRAPTFYVLNKIDHIRPAERADVQRFVETTLADELGTAPPLFVLSARAVLDGEPEATSDARAVDGFDALVAALKRFIAEDLVEVRLVTARRELARLGSSLHDALTVEGAALALDAAALVEKVEQFRTAAGAQRSVFDDDRTLLARDVAQLAAGVGERLAAFARAAPPRYEPAVLEIVSIAPRGKLTSQVRAGIETAVRAGFDEFRVEEADRTEEAWHDLADGFRRRTQERIDAVRAAAGELFSVSLPPVEIPAVVDQQERFFYLFLHLDFLGASIGRLLGRLVPSRIARRRAARSACAELADEYDKHAGRVRYDLTTRLDGARSHFEAAMADELAASIDAILEAAARADKLGRAAADARDRQLAQAARAEALAAALVDLERDP